MHDERSKLVDVRKVRNADFDPDARAITSQVPGRYLLQATLLVLVQAFTSLDLLHPAMAFEQRPASPSDTAAIVPRRLEPLGERGQVQQQIPRDWLDAREQR